jgi:hypothetical protein
MIKSTPWVCAKSTMRTRIAGVGHAVDLDARELGGKSRSSSR